MKRSLFFNAAAILCGLSSQLSAQAVQAVPVTGKTLIQRASVESWANQSILIVTTNGTRIVIDAFKPVPDLKPNILLITHDHWDHNDSALLSQAVADTNCVVLNIRPNTNVVKNGVAVTGISAAHNPTGVSENSPTDVIYLIETDGLRIAHTGDLGQFSITDKQLKALGKIDILITQLNNTYSELNVSRALKLIGQINPQIVIPAHTSDDANKKAAEKIGNAENLPGFWNVNSADLADGKKKMIILQ